MCHSRHGQSPAKQEGDPSSHARTDKDRRPSGKGQRAYFSRLIEPAAYRSIFEAAARLAVTRIVEAKASGALGLSPLRERFGLCAFHLRFKAAKPDEGRSIPFRLQETVGYLSCLGIFGFDREQLQFSAVHLMLQFESEKNQMPWISPFSVAILALMGFGPQ
jgi:hypothetical protein